jgi:hypothetical protein
MKSIHLIAILLLMSCNDAQDETALFPDAYIAVFESFPELGIKDPSIFRTLDKSLDEDVIRQDLNTSQKEALNRTGFDIEHTVSIWEKYKGKDLSAYVTEEYLHFLAPKDSIIDKGTRVSFSAPVFNSDTSFFFIYLVSETNEVYWVNRTHRYLMYTKKKGSWIWAMATAEYPDI